MLILVRKVEQTIVMHTADGEITLTLLEFDRDRVKLGIEAPQSVNVVRGEVPEYRR